MFSIMEIIRLLPLALAAALFATDGVAAQEAPETLIDRWVANPAAAYPVDGTDLEDLRFIARPVVVFADSPNDPQFLRQIELLGSRIDDLVVRDVIVLIDTDPAARSPIRQALRPRGFTLVLIGKDGRIAQRKPSPFTVRELTRAIDKLPLRQQEIRDANQPPE